MTPGIYLLHKPVGPTSFSLVRHAMEGSKLRMCHGGTLDPFAHGLLLMLVGPATRLFDYLHSVPKVYEGMVRWGVETDNGDLLGKTTFEGDASGLTAERLAEALAGFVGWREQTPPVTSAKRVGGERAYVRAHRGEEVVMPPVRVYLHEARWLGHELARRESRLRIVVRGGYYVRALVRDLGRMLGCGAHLTGLHRTAIGPWADPGEGRTVEVHGREVMPWTRSRVLSDYEVGELRGGRPIALGEIGAEWEMPVEFVEADGPVRGFHLGRLVYLLREVEGKLEVLRELRGGV